MQSKFPRSITQTIPASGMVALNVSGNFYYVLSATSDVLIKPDTGGVPLLNPSQTGVRNMDSFTRLEVQNTTAAPNTVTIIAGTDTQYIDQR